MTATAGDLGAALDAGVAEAPSQITAQTRPRDLQGWFRDPLSGGVEISAL
jgi:hypothetical protein